MAKKSFKGRVRSVGFAAAKRVRRNGRVLRGINGPVVAGLPKKDIDS